MSTITYLCVARYNGTWGSITNYGWKRKADCYATIAKEANDIHHRWSEGQNNKVSRSYQIYPYTSLIAVKEFSFVEALALYSTLYKKAWGNSPYKGKDIESSFGISIQKFRAIGNKAFGEVSWKGVKVWGKKIG